MAITLTYQPDKSISFGELLLPWGVDRQKIRILLNGNYEINDSVIELNQYNNGETSQNIVQRRDIYKNYLSQDNFFFLNFDENDKLQDIEIHHGLVINIGTIIVSFEMDIEKVADLINGISSSKRKISEGEYLFEDLKLAIASSEAMGGEGNELSYFYCSGQYVKCSDDG